VLGAGFNPLDGPPAGLFRGQSTDRHLRVTSDLDAEAASDVEGLTADFIDVNIQMRGQELDREGREGVVAPIINAVVFGIPFGDDDIVFERRR
jgi:hypothetical protein